MGSSESKSNVKQGVLVTVHSCSEPIHVDGIIKHIEKHMQDVVENVSFKQLPYNISELNEFSMRGIDVLLLCHSVDLNRGFSITNVENALYDEFLPRAKTFLGKCKVGVIVHDVPEPEMSARMDTFRSTQSKTFENADLVLIGGQLKDDPVELTTKQLDELKRFFTKASSQSWVEYISNIVFNIFRWLGDMFTWFKQLSKITQG